MSKITLIVCLRGQNENSTDVLLGGPHCIKQLMFVNPVDLIGNFIFFFIFCGKFFFKFNQ